MIECLTKCGFASVSKTLRSRLHEAAPSRVQFLVGPRQVGKTTLLLEIAEQLGEQAFYASADAPEAALPAWADGIWRRALDRARKAPAILLLDEIHSIPDWSRWLKARFDALLREKIPLHVVATGSSALILGAGARETMAGRFERTTLSHWGASDLAQSFAIPREEAPYRVVARGGYPGAVAFWGEEPRWLAYIRDSIIEPAIGRDILHLEKVRKPALLRQVFALCAAHPAEILSLEKMAGSLAEKGALETISHYLELLSEAFLVRAIHKFSGSELRRRKSPPKLVALNNALLSAVGAGQPPSPDSDPRRWGRWVENACLAHAINAGCEVFYWREEPWEADAIIRAGDEEWLVEVKTGDFGVEDLRGFSHAAAKFPRMRPVVLCDPGKEEAARSAGFEAMAWTEYLLG